MNYSFQLGNLGQAGRKPFTRFLRPQNVFGTVHP